MNSITEESFTEIKDLHIEGHISLTLKNTLEKHLAFMYILKCTLGF